MKRQGTDWEKIITYHLFDKGFKFRIHKELSELNNKLIFENQLVRLSLHSR